MATQFTAQTVTISASTLANGSARESASVTSDVAVNLNDYRLTVKPVLAAGTPSGAKAVFVWVKTSSDGSNWDGNATASDLAITLDDPHQFQLAAVIPFPTSSSRGGSFSLKQACGGSIPRNWGIIIENRTGLAFTACLVGCNKESTT